MNSKLHEIDISKKSIYNNPYCLVCNVDTKQNSEMFPDQPDTFENVLDPRPCQINTQCPSMLYCDKSEVKNWKDGTYVSYDDIPLENLNFGQSPPFSSGSINPRFYFENINVESELWRLNIPDTKSINPNFDSCNPLNIPNLDIQTCSKPELNNVDNFNFECTLESLDPINDKIWNISTKRSIIY